MKRNQMTLSFGEYDDDVYDYLQGLKNASGLIRQLVRVHMQKDNIVIDGGYAEELDNVMGKSLDEEVEDIGGKNIVIKFEDYKNKDD